MQGQRISLEDALKITARTHTYRIVWARSVKEKTEAGWLTLQGLNHEFREGTLKIIADPIILDPKSDRLGAADCPTLAQTADGAYWFVRLQAVEELDR
jgi:hypothetical protein